MEGVPYIPFVLIYKVFQRDVTHSNTINLSRESVQNMESVQIRSTTICHIPPKFLIPWDRGSRW